MASVAVTAVTAAVIVASAATTPAAISSTAATATITWFGDFNFYFLPINGCSVEFINGILGATVILHGHKCKSFSCVVNIIYTATFAEFIFQKISRARG